jgi:hypothetical protein
MRFTCREHVRLASYKAGQVISEHLHEADYLLVLDPVVERLEERRSGTRTVVSSTLPPAYSWLLLFAPRYQSYFAFLEQSAPERLSEVRTIRFRGSLPFVDGSDIRQWQGIALLDRATNEMLEVDAEPFNQEARAAYARARGDLRLRVTVRFDGPSFLSSKTWRVGRRPETYRYRATFGVRKDGLLLPSESRYEIRNIVGDTENLRLVVATTFDEYRLFETSTIDEYAKRP